MSRRQFWELIDSIRVRRPRMSVIVATAYMDEASRFDWLAAMDDGKVIAQGAPKEILARANKTTLDEAFIALLPPEKRGQHQEVVVRPRAASDDKTPAIEADGLTRRFGDFVAVDHVSFRIGRGEIFGFLGSNGCGKTTTMKMMTGLLPVDRGLGEIIRQADGRRRHGGAPKTSATCRRRFRSTASSRSARTSICTRGSTICRQTRSNDGSTNCSNDTI